MGAMTVLLDSNQLYSDMTINMKSSSYTDDVPLLLEMEPEPISPQQTRQRHHNNKDNNNERKKVVRFAEPKESDIIYVDYIYNENNKEKCFYTFDEYQMMMEEYQMEVFVRSRYPTLLTMLPLSFFSSLYHANEILNADL